MTITELREKLDEAMPQALKDAKDSRKVAPNSYGAAWNEGYLQALQTVLNTINGEEDNIL